MVQWIWPILQNIVFWVYDAQNPFYEDIQPTIEIKRSNHLAIRVKHIDVPIHYVLKKYVLLTIDPVKFRNTIHTEDTGTKSFTGLILERQYSYICGSWY